MTSETPDTPSTEALTPLLMSCTFDMPHITPDDVRVLAIRLRYSALGRQEAADSAWLIERGQPERQTPTVWWTGHDWTEDANKATRYASQDDAEARIASDFTPPPSRGGPSARAVEHRWLDTSYHARRVARRRQEAADTSGPIIRAIQSDWRFQHLPDVPPDDATIARLRAIAVGEAADTSGLREAAERLMAAWDAWSATPKVEQSGSIPVPTDVFLAVADIRTALEGATERPLDVETAADDVRYAHGNGPSDYWRGYNDGIDRLVSLLASPTTTEEA